VSDPLGLTAQGLPSLERGADAPGQVLAVRDQWEATTIVVGLPLNMNGSRGPAARAAEAFASELGQRSQVLVVLQDERLSTVTAERVLVECGVNRARRRTKGLVDRGAAAVILQSYLDRMRKA